jgi:hypothetical protein
LSGSQSLNPALPHAASDRKTKSFVDLLSAQNKNESGYAEGLGKNTLQGGLADLAVRPSLFQGVRNLLESENGSQPNN